MTDNRITLNSQQSNAEAGILASFQNPSQQLVLLQGEPGTGKTTTLGSIVKKFGVLRQWTGEGNYSVPTLRCTAPTHRAAAQFQASLQREGIDLEVTTLHSLLRVHMERDPKTGMLRNNRDQEFTLPQGTKAVFLDECSMVPDWMLRRLLSGMNKLQTLVGIGDSRQLPPVGSNDMNMLFTHADLEFNLTKVERHSGSILNLCRRVRRIGLPHPKDLRSSGSVMVTAGFRFDREVETALRVASRKNEPDSLRILAYSNREVDEWAWVARKIFYNLGATFEPWVTSERLTNCDSLVDLDDDMVLLPPSSELVMVKASNKRMVTDSKIRMGGQFEPFRIQECSFKEIHTGLTYYADVVCPEDITRFKREQKEMKNWVSDPANEDDSDLRRVGECYTERSLQFMQLQPQFASTFHKSQGSSVDNVFVDLTDSLRFRSRDIVDHETIDRAFYVGCSRAKERLVIKDGRPRRN